MSFDRRRLLALAPVLLFLAACAEAETAPPATIDELATQSLAQIEGEIDLPGLREQDRLWQMEMWRRWHEGTLLEIFGPEAFDYDVRTRLMMFRGPWDAAERTSYHPEGEAIFTAFANVVNAFIEQNADYLPAEF
jgi:hypothetical protein